MKNILILADGSIARHFIDWVNHKRVAENTYSVVCYKVGLASLKIGKQLSMIYADPTSFAKLNAIMTKEKYHQVFIVMDEKEDAHYSLKNIRMIEPKLSVVLLNPWSDESVGEGDEYLTTLYPDELMASHLYEHLPNVPVVAQNVGLGRGEIMEIQVPFGSSYAYRHVASILQRKWKIAAIYRNEKQILPTNATMIRPNDTLLVLGKPIVLDGVYKSINNRTGLFPEPFGKNLYLLLNFVHDQDKALLYLKESLYLSQQLENKALFVRIINPGNFALTSTLKAYESEHVTFSICYSDEDLKSMIEYDIQEYDIGLILNSIKTFQSDGLGGMLYDLHKLVYLFGDKLLYNIKESMVVMSSDEMMESISSTAFEISEALNLQLTLGDFDPEGEFESRKQIIEHYETLTHIFNREIRIEQKIANPVRELLKRKEMLEIAPFKKELQGLNLFRLLSTRVEDFLLMIEKHPKLLVPFESNGE